MKYHNFIVSLIFVLGSVETLSAQSDSAESNVNDSIMSYVVTLVEDVDMRIYENQSKDRFKLYPTENIYTLLKLDTQTGQIEQIQWSLDSKKEGSVTINGDDLSWNAGIVGTFELYPTQNMYQFVLLNKANGRTWHVQWGMKDKERWIRRIY